MKTDNPIEKFAVAMGIGAVFLVGLFLFVDARVDGFRDSFEQYALSKSWAVIVAVPALTITYMLGSILSVISDQAFRLVAPKGYQREWDILGLIARTENELLHRHFEEIKRTKRLLEGGSISIGGVGIGCLFQMPRHPEMSCLLFTTGVLLIVAAFSMSAITSRLSQSLEQLDYAEWREA